jgi:hypothetical protein
MSIAFPLSASQVKSHYRRVLFYLVDNYLKLVCLCRLRVSARLYQSARAGV